MKRFTTLLIALCVLFPFSGCNSKKDSANTAVFYYVQNKPEYGTASGMIAANVVEVKGRTDHYRILLEKYFNGPTNYDCVSPFPAGITLEDFQISGDKAQILLSPHMAILTGPSMTVALACLTRTVIEMTDVETVQIQIKNNQINGVDALTLTLNSFTYWDDVQSAADN